MNEIRIASFIEYVLRPLSEDWKDILTKLAEFKLPLTESFIKRTVFYVGCWHLVGELIRAATYVAITWIICQTVIGLWPHLPA